MISRTLRHYRIEERLGAGGMGEVYRATDEHLHRDVAIKVLPPGTLEDEEARKRFHKEALTLSKLNHPHVAHVYDFDTQDGTDFLVMEYVPGDSLAARLDKGPLPESEVLRIGAQVADALHEAHTRGIVHRDLKPGNIALDTRDNAKVLDFGIARLLRSDEDRAETITVDSLTKTQGLSGTLPYMAPEQLSGRPADERSDVYSLGVVLYEMTAGRRPFAGTNPATLIHDILETPPTPLLQVSENTSSALDQLVRRCLQKNPSARFRTAAEVREAITNLKTGGQDTATRLFGQKDTPRSRSFPLVPAGLSVLALAVFVAVAANLGGVRDRLFGSADGRSHSIAVLPLENLTGYPEQEYLVEGMHQQMITELSKVAALRVISRTSVQRFRDTDLSLRQIGETLEVQELIEGSVFWEGDKVRINVQLIDARTEETLWADSFIRDMADVLNLHAEIARTVVGEIQMTLTPKEETMLTAKRIVDPEAYDAYLRGVFHWDKLTPQGLELAQHYFELALEKDPDYALAHAGIASVWGGRQQMGMVSAHEAAPRMKEACLKALELDDQLPEAYLWLAVVESWYEYDWDAADRDYRRAIELNPVGGRARAAYSHFLSAVGRHQEALAQAEKALELDPYNFLARAFHAVVLTFHERYDEAIGEFQEVLEISPDLPPAYSGLWASYHAKHMEEEAFTAFRSQFASTGNDALVDAIDQAYSQGGYRAAMLRAAEIYSARAETAYVPAMMLAEIYTLAGDHDRALDWLERAYENRDPNLPYLGEPHLAPLRSYPRYQELRRKMNLPPLT